jgi:hypothetical protein
MVLVDIGAPPPADVDPISGCAARDVQRTRFFIRLRRRPRAAWVRALIVTNALNTYFRNPAS